MQIPQPHKGRPASVTDKEAVALRDKRALELKKAGYRVSLIQGELGYADEKSVYASIRRQIRRIPAAEAAEYRKLQDARCDDLLAAIWPDATGGNLPAVDRAIAIERLRAELVGTYAPKKQEIAGEGGGPIRFTLLIPKNDPGQEGGDAQ